MLCEVVLRFYKIGDWEPFDILIRMLYSFYGLASPTRLPLFYSYTLPIIMWNFMDYP